MVVKRANLSRFVFIAPIEDGAFIETDAGLHAFIWRRPRGKSVIIVGAGTIGLLALQCARNWAREA